VDWVVEGRACFEDAKMGMNSANSSSCVLLLGVALCIGGSDVGGIDCSGRVSECFDEGVEELEPHHQTMMTIQLEIMWAIL
jgi:hypothetical protein